MDRFLIQALLRTGRAPTVRLLAVPVTLLAISAETAGAPRVRVELGPERTSSPAHHKGRERQILHSRQCVLDTGAVRYAVCWKAGVDPSVPDRVFPVEGYIGMPRPTSCNWYHSGFLFIRLNGKEVGTAPLYAMYAPETVPRGILDMVWRTAEGAVRVRFVALPGADYLACVIDIEPGASGTIQSVQVMLRCYPSYFTAYHHRAGRRHLITPSADILQGPRKTVAAARNWWCVYTDDVFDPDRGEGEGPCAMLFDPVRAGCITFDPGSYGVTTTIDFAPDVRQIRFLFWEFKGAGNKKAVRRLRTDSSALLRTLRALDPAPATVSKIDLAAVQRAVAAVRENPGLRKQIGNRARETVRWLERSRSVLSGNRRSLVDEADLFVHQPEMETFVWEVRLAELLQSVAGER